MNAPHLLKSGHRNSCLFITMMGWLFTLMLPSAMASPLLRVGRLALLEMSAQPSGLQPGSSGNTNSDRQTPASSTGLQRGSSVPSDDGKDKECQRRHSDWDRNVATRSASYGFILFFVILCLLTIARISTSVVRAFTSFAGALVLGALILGLQKADLFKVCPSPPGFLSALSGDLAIWTLIGIGLGMSLIYSVQRFVVIRRKFTKKEVTP